MTTKKFRTNTIPKIIQWQDGEATRTRNGAAILTISVQHRFRQKRSRTTETTFGGAPKYTWQTCKRPMTIKTSPVLLAFLLLCLVVPSHSFSVSRRSFARIATSLVPALAPEYCSAKNLPTVYADTSKAGTVDTLVPVLKLRESLATLDSRLKQDASLSKYIESLVSSLPRVESNFKALFDASSDPISYKQKFVDQNAFLVYYSKGFDGPDRPSIESDLPVKNTLQYGARNEAWIAFEEFLAEYDYYTSHPGGSTIDDFVEPLQKTIKAVDSYVAFASPDDARQAQERMTNER